MPGLLLAALFAGGVCLQPLENHLQALVATPAGGDAGQLAAMAGSGGVLAVLGGMRPALAGCCWLQADLAWEKRDPAATAALIQLTVAADARPLYFWLNGARMLAYDLPAWEPTWEPAAVRRHRTDAHSRLALGFLEQGLRWHGPDAALWVEMANIHLRRTGDLESAARCYRLAAEAPHAPFYAARIHAELLRALGRPREARDWLQRQLAGLPADDPAACRDVVLARIRSLDRELAAQ
jgi:hypothetical protein